MSTTTKNTLATKTVSQGESRYGTPEPQIALPFLKGTSYRVVKAALHKLAAEIELSTPASERWCVNTEDFNESGRVYIELADATPAEAARGMAMLKRARAVSHEQAPESTGRLARPTLLVDRKRDLCKMASKLARRERSRARDARERDRHLRRDEEKDKRMRRDDGRPARDTSLER